MQNLRSLVARLHEGFNERDLDAWSEVFDEDVELVVDGAAFRGVAAARGYVTAVFREFPGLRIHGARIVAESGVTIVVEHQILNGDPSLGPLRPQGSVCEIYRVRDGRVVAYTSYYAPEDADREDVVNVPSRAEGSKLAEEQAALRRVATLVARGVSQDELFAAVNEEVGWLVGADPTALMRFETDDTVTLVAAWSAADAGVPIGARRPLDDALRSMRDDGHAVRFGPLEVRRDGPFVEEARRLAIRSAVGVPIVVDRVVWGVAFAASTREEPFPEHTETRLAQFTELLATAISNTEARADANRLAEEQAALRRVATLVARESSPSEVAAAVAKEVAGLLGVENMRMVRYEADATVTVVAGWGDPDAAFPVGSRLPLGGKNIASQVLRTERPARIEYAIATGAIGAYARSMGNRSAVGAPIVVDGRLWGVMVATSPEAGSLPAGTESRLENFTELVATAISNTEARAEVERLAEEQAALRRVATLVARGVPPADVFEAIAREAGRLLGVDAMHMGRYDTDGAISVAGWSRAGDHLSVGTRVELDGTNVASLVLQSGRPERIDGYTEAGGTTAERMRHRMRVYSSVAVPIVVDGRLWGLMIASSKEDRPLPADAESRLLGFTELAEMAISNTEARTEVAASRARIVVATDEERRRVVRDLHDGAQQRLVHTIITLKLAHRAVQNEREDATALLTEALDQAEQATAELRELAHGILPAVLTQGGLRAGVDALAARMPVPVENGVSVGRLPAAVEATAYFVVAEALTNVAKHARAERAAVTARVKDGTLVVHVRDDGVGGAQRNGSGLTGLTDRLAALDGELRVESPADRGTLVAATIPLPG